MREIQAVRFGGPEVLELRDAPDPSPGPGQVVIETTVIDTIHIETMIRRGLATEWFPVQPPYVPGGGVAGRVVAVGEGVAPDLARRWRHVVTSEVVNGAYAERVVAPADALIPVPDVGLREAAALVHDGTTAIGVLEPTNLRAGEWVLITAAAGGMGLLLVQLARAAGARVIGAARGERKLAVVRELGAELVVDYTEPGWTEKVRAATGGAGVDVLWDGAGGEIGLAAFAQATADGARVSAHGAPSGGFGAVDRAEAVRRGITLRGIEHLQRSAENDHRAWATRALNEAAYGRIRPHIGATFPLERAADAHAAIESREVVGKTLLLV
ncbi:zinc-binding dehydrogenase [Streptomyces sp. 6N223]|uniref:zinc-binding dehydrogenase n=1 Tax=Streptomyces sp. 6N223 TaxID=3457412 RepID=UPI003FD04C7E